MPSVGLHSYQRLRSCLSLFSSAPHSIHVMPDSPLLTSFRRFEKTVRRGWPGGVPRYMVCGFCFFPADMAGSSAACCMSVSSCASSNMRTLKLFPRPPLSVLVVKRIVPPFLSTMACLPFVFLTWSSRPRSSSSSSFSNGSLAPGTSRLTCRRGGRCRRSSRPA